jgi:hypothetical protein
MQSLVGLLTKVTSVGNLVPFPGSFYSPGPSILRTLLFSGPFRLPRRSVVSDDMGAGWRGFSLPARNAGCVRRSRLAGRLT